MSEQHIVIVGGGFSGTALAVHLGRLGQAGLRVTLIEPRSQLAQGVAYSTADPAHRLNVPASRMQLAGDEEGSFDRWYRASDAYVSDPAARWHDGHVYPQRRQFARWVNAQFEAAQRESPVVLAHLQDRAVAFRDGTVSTAAGTHLAADIVVLAVSHPAPSLPGALTALADHPAIIADPWQEKALASVGPEERIAIVGSGLTMADMVATLDRQGTAALSPCFHAVDNFPGPISVSMTSVGRLKGTLPGQRVCAAGYGASARTCVRRRRAGFRGRSSLMRFVGRARPSGRACH